MLEKGSHTETKVTRGWESSAQSKVVETRQEPSWNVHSEPSWKWLILPPITLSVLGPSLMLPLLPRLKCLLFLHLSSLSLSPSPAWPVTEGYSTFLSTPSASHSKIVNLSKIQVMPGPHPTLSLCRERTELSTEVMLMPGRTGAVVGALI